MTLLLVVGAIAGALFARGVGTAMIPVGLVVLVVARRCGLRRAVLLAVVVGAVTSHSAARAWQATSVPATGPHHGVARLVGDPVPRAGGGWRAEIRLEGRRFDAVFGPSVSGVATLSAGQSIEVAGDVRHPPRRWQRTRHVAGSLIVERVGSSGPAGWWHRVANGLRSVLTSGAQTLGDDRVPLFTGLVIGDDRLQGPVVADDFRAAGLGHLLAVSGQNVAFVLTAAGPLLLRLGRHSRVAVTLVLLVFFALVTRFEPSVLRATVMAGGSALTVAAGRPLHGLRLLGLAVVALLVIDPLLIHRAAFQLSVAASGGILLGARLLATVVPGPRWLAEAVAVTLAAQAAVTPLLLVWFGPVPAAALAANVLAAPLAGMVMVWGVTAGLLAGAVGPPFAAWIHTPTAWALDWIAGVAGFVGRHPTGRLPAVAAVAVVALVAVTALAAHGERRALARWSLGAVVASLAVVAAVAFARPAVPGSGRLSRVSDTGGIVVVDASIRDAEPLLAELRVMGVADPGIIVFRHGIDERVAAAMATRFGAPALWAPMPARGVVVPAGGELLVDGRTRWRVDHYRGHLVVREVP